jgi:CDP-diacylglycerol pyrophosphatase
MSDRRSQALPAYGANTNRQLAERVNQVVKGRTDNYGTFTLTPSTTTTTVNDPNVSENSTVNFMPTTANAAGAIATTYIGTIANGSFTVTHANNAQVDRTFRYSAHG